MVKNQPDNAGHLRDSSSIPGLGRSPGGGHGNPPVPCLENPWEPGRVQSHKDSDMTEQLSMCMLLAGEGLTTSDEQGASGLYGESAAQVRRLCHPCPCCGVRECLRGVSSSGTAAVSPPSLLWSARMPHSLTLSTSLERAQFIDTGAYGPSRREPTDLSVSGSYFLSSDFYLIYLAALDK